MHVAFVGLANSHPFTDAAVLRRLGPTELTVLAEPERTAKFLQAHHARTAPSLDAVVAAEPDAAVVTVHPAQVAETVAELTGNGIAVFVNKPAAIDRDQVRGLAAARHDAPLMTTSVLRYAPAVARLRDQLADHSADVLTVRAVVRHDVGHWINGDRDWQDSPAGGGLVATMGIHAIEVMVSALGTDIVEVAAQAARRHYLQVRSEDVASIALRWADGRLGVVEVIGVADRESYQFCVHCPGTDISCEVPGAGSEPLHDLGYVDTIAAFRSMVTTGVSPIPWEQTEAVLGAVADARAGTSPTG